MMQLNGGGTGKGSSNSKSIAAFYSKYGMFFILLCIFLLSTFLSPNFIKVSNLLNVLRNMAAIGLTAFGMTFILILGMIDLSVGSVMAFVGCLACVIARDTQMVWLAILIAIIAGGIIGIFNGFIVTKFGIPAFIMTMATQNIARGAALLLTDGRPVSDMGDGFRVLGQGYAFDVIPIPIIVMLVCLGICWLVLSRTKFGRYVFATGGNPQAAKASGVSVNQTVIKAFTFHGFLVGLAGVMLMSRLNSGQPAGAMNYEFSAITAGVVGGTSLAGGTGNMLGTFIGALIVAILDNIMVLKGVNNYWQYVIKGTVIALAVIADFKTKEVLNRSK